MDTLGHKLACFTTFGGSLNTAMKEKMKGLKHAFEECRRVCFDHKKTRVQNQPRDVVDLLLDTMDVTTDPESSFHEKSEFFRSWS